MLAELMRLNGVINTNEARRREVDDRLEARFNQLVLYFLATAVGGLVTLAGYIVTQR